jgi:hypothetical protein
MRRVGGAGVQGAPPGGPARTAVRAGSWFAGARHARDGRHGLPCHDGRTCCAPGPRVCLGGGAGRGMRSACAGAQRSRGDRPGGGRQGALPDVCARSAPARAEHGVAGGGPGSEFSEHGGNGADGHRAGANGIGEPAWGSRDAGQGPDGSQPGAGAAHHGPEHDGAVEEEPEALQVPFPLAVRQRHAPGVCVVHRL